MDHKNLRVKPNYKEMLHIMVSTVTLKNLLFSDPKNLNSSEKQKMYFLCCS